MTSRCDITWINDLQTRREIAVKELAECDRLLAEAEKPYPERLAEKSVIEERGMVAPYNPVGCATLNGYVLPLWSRDSLSALRFYIAEFGKKCMEEQSRLDAVPVGEMPRAEWKHNQVTVQCGVGTFAYLVNSSTDAKFVAENTNKALALAARADRFNEGWKAGAAAQQKFDARIANHMSSPVIGDEIMSRLTVPLPPLKGAAKK